MFVANVICNLLLHVDTRSHCVFVCVCDERECMTGRI